eukprot:TRINITY_DN2447_c0_g2_i2.p1 TRINITY_DN2447_c0_g2~~TRINITY_DN2447_c0_g2_i2.p1  ORF type:complete len:295 (+),score=47.32 TRINITY_DN2447_c0_g2_i2:48-887(+)
MCIRDREISETQINTNIPNFNYKMGVFSKLNNYFWPEDMGDVSSYLGNDDPGKLRKLKIYRAVALSLYIPLYIHSYFGMAGEYHYYVIAFTQWGLFITSLTLLSLLIGVNVDSRGTSGRLIHKLAFVLFETAWTSEVVITTVFWAILVVIAFKKVYEYNAVVIIFMIESHTLPLAMLAIDFYQNQMVFRKRHGFLVAIIPLLYAGMSILLAVKFGIHAYPILTWKDYTSLLYGGLVVLLFVLAFVAGYLIGERKHRRRTKLMETPVDVVTKEDDVSLIV